MDFGTVIHRLIGRKMYFSQPVEKSQVGRPRPQTALCGPPRVSATKPCATLVLGYALHGFLPFLALVGLRPPFSAAKPCATLVLGYALHGFQPFLALVGLRPPLVAGFGLR